jgi:anti-anti-sigma factor
VDAATRLEIRLVETADGPVLYLRGQLDIVSRPALEGVAETVCAGPPTAIVTLDLYDLEFLDCAGAGGLQSLANRFAGRVIARRASQLHELVLSLTTICIEFSANHLGFGPNGARHEQGNEIAITPQVLGRRGPNPGGGSM